MFSNLTGWHALIILGIIILIFGAQKLPALARSVGQSTKIFQAEMKRDRIEEPLHDEASDEEPTLSAGPLSNARK